MLLKHFLKQTTFSSWLSLWIDSIPTKPNWLLAMGFLMDVIVPSLKGQMVSSTAGSLFSATLAASPGAAVAASIPFGYRPFCGYEFLMKVFIFITGFGLRLLCVKYDYGNIDFLFLRLNYTMTNTGKAESI